MLLALDIASVTGVAFGGPTSGAPRTLRWELPKGPENFGRALKALRTSTMAFLKFNRVEILYYEASLQVIDRWHSEQAAYVLTSFAAVAHEAAESYGGCRIIKAVNCDEWRRSFIGTARVSTDEGKKMAMGRCRQLGWNFEDHNAAEAAGLWYYGMATTYPTWRPARAA